MDTDIKKNVNEYLFRKAKLKIINKFKYHIESKLKI